MRFNYVQYDEESKQKSEKAKELCEALESHIETIGSGRAKALALTALEETYMWIGKGIRDEQCGRGSQTAHVPERSAE